MDTVSNLLKLNYNNQNRFNIVKPKIKPSIQNNKKLTFFSDLNRIKPIRKDNNILPTLSFINNNLDFKLDSLKTNNEIIKPQEKQLFFFENNQNDNEVNYQKSKYHSSNKFIPKYSMTSYHESGSYRKKDDPYAVGAISNPSKSQDIGGKTYGIYQFESRVYRNGSKGKGVNGSTLMRFMKWSGNPYGKELKSIADKYGVASSTFDKKWKELSKNQNKQFGIAQQEFLKHDKSNSVNKFFDRANIPESVRKDERIFDLILGTTNHIGTLSNSIADHVKYVQNKKGKPLSAEELGTTITKYKQTKVKSWFRSSPKAHRGVLNRFKAEQKVFA